jgi:hypothetical protein
MSQGPETGVSKISFQKRITIMAVFDNIFCSVYGSIDYSDFKSIFTELENTEKEIKKIGFVAARIEAVSSLLRTSHNIGNLIVYLLLTCFDILGQNKEWMNFDTWLKSGKNKVERNDILSNIDVNKDLLHKVKDILLEYNKIYGARTSFNNFIDNILPDESRSLLLNSIRNTRDGIADNLENRKLLYEIRNNYTHHGFGVPIGAIYNRMAPPGWTIYIGGFGVYSDIELYDWPATLFYAVKEGFAAYIKRMSQEKIDTIKKERFLLDVKDFVPSAFKSWKIEHVNNLTGDAFLREVTNALNVQGSKRDIRSAGYGFDWIIKDIRTNRVLNDLTIKTGDESKPLLREYKIMPNSNLKVIDIQNKLKFSENSIHIKRKLSNGSYLYATYQNKVLDEFGNENDERFSNVKEWQEVTYE